MSPLSDSDSFLLNRFPQVGQKASEKTFLMDSLFLEVAIMKKKTEILLFIYCLEDIQLMVKYRKNHNIMNEIYLELTTTKESLAKQNSNELINFQVGLLYKCSELYYARASLVPRPILLRYIIPSNIDIWGYLFITRQLQIKKHHSIVIERKFYFSIKRTY